MFVYYYSLYPMVSLLNTCLLQDHTLPTRHYGVIYAVMLLTFAAHLCLQLLLVLNFAPALWCLIFHSFGQMRG